MSNHWQNLEAFLGHLRTKLADLATSAEVSLDDKLKEILRSFPRDPCVSDEADPCVSDEADPCVSGDTTGLLAVSDDTTGLLLAPPHPPTQLPFPITPQQNKSE